MYEKGVEPNSRSTSSDSSYSSSSNPGSVTPNYSNEKSTKNSSRKTTALSNFEFNDKKVSNFVNRDKVRLVRGKIVRGQKEMPKHFSSYDLTAVKKRPRLTVSHSGAVLHFIN